ncbi:MAG TPA: hypothetical protein VFX76_22610, partial [Roseiflexaceae bacterium]|nr:hypothetical protein [Roseiflexaceae bacterium]
ATARPFSAALMVERIASAEQLLKSGHLTVTLDYGDGNQSLADMRFDFGTSEQPARYRIVSTYGLGSSAQTVERIIIDDRSWQRQAGGGWVEQPAQDSVGEQIRSYLPRAAEVANPSATREGNDAILRWYDVGRDVDATLVVDPATGIPRELRQQGRNNRTSVTVIYESWNADIAITPPVQ